MAGACAEPNRYPIALMGQLTTLLTMESPDTFPHSEKSDPEPLIHMYVECPHCHAIFRVTKEILARAGGKVRCGECGVVFEVVDLSAVEHDEPPTDEMPIPPNGAEANEDDGEIEVVSEASEQSVIEPVVSDTPPSSDSVSRFDDVSAEAVEERESESIELAIDEHESLDVKNGGQRRQAWPVGLLILAGVLLLLLLAQIIVAKRNAVVQTMPVMRPLVTGLCRIAGCVVDPRRDVAQIELASHSVFSHPQSKGALMIQAAIVNHADFAQPYPIIDLTLTDIQGRPVARRRFAPEEYLDNLESMAPMMEPGVTVPVRIEVSDPGKNALAFEFEFL